MAADISTILALEVPLIVHLAERSITLEAVLKLTPGSILELGKNSEDELDILVNNRQIGKGLAVKIGENFGIEVTEINDSTERVKAMGTPVSGGDSPAEDDDFDAIAAAMLAGQ
jgi:flagellar motor switch protein FliN